MSVEALYKYGKLGEHSEALFSSPTVWFSSPSALNDPFECRPWFDFSGTEEQVTDFLVRMLRKRDSTLSTEAAAERARAIHDEGRLRDPRFSMFFRRDIVRLIARDVGLCCFSTTNTNILMWSHYAQDHQGYCLEFAATETTPFFGEAQKVKYATEFPMINFFSTPHDAQVDLLFLTKFEGWKYETEYRIVDHQGGAGLHEYPEELLKSVTFGLRMPQDHKQKIRQWLQTRGHSVAVYQAAIDEREFKIVVTEAP